MRISYKFHSKNEAYIGELSAAHGSTSVISFISERPCDIAAAATNEFLEMGYITTRHYIMFADPKYKLKEKWDALQGRTGGYMYKFLDSNKDYYITILHTLVDRNALPVNVSRTVYYQALKSVIGTKPPINGCGQESTPPYNYNASCYYLMTDIIFTQGRSTAFDPLNPWPTLHAPYPAP
jgi:hypothetical protein